LSHFVTKIVFATFIIDHPPLQPKTLAHICAWGCSKYSIDLRILLLQSLVYKVFVLLLKKERKKEQKKQKKFLLLKKILLLKKKVLAAKTKERAKKKKRGVDEK
jgi:hypothetical protein